MFFNSFLNEARYKEKRWYLKLTFHRWGAETQRG